MRKTLFAATLVILPLLAACGSDTESAPALTEADLSKALQETGFKDPAFADCAAKIYLAEGISQEGLQKMISGESDAQTADPETMGLGPEDKPKADSATAKIIDECLGVSQ
ncbi:hypothetical protein [Nocardia flavorosea]|uniref:Lipoprotein n=1 Tax=Nocardia flavorosea TaxID=53429 RepID=A0A846YRZ0_9NOCA|nr:hypothetical protein [Nocardia flavorosea]NKY60198.1 hypothetical protein [Nocardia flavorosea]